MCLHLDWNVSLSTKSLIIITITQNGKKRARKRMAYVGILAPRPPASVETLSYAHLRRRVASPSSTIPLFLKVLPERVVAKRFNFRRRPIAALLAGMGAGGAVLQDAGATTLVIAGAYGLVSTFDNLTRRNIIKQVIFFPPFRLCFPMHSLMCVQWKFAYFCVWCNSGWVC